MAPQAWSTNNPNPAPDAAGYRVYDLTIELVPRRVRRAGTVIPLKALSFDLLVTLVRSAPALVSFEQLSERVWPGLVITPETIVQRVKLLRGALGDDAQAPRYIEGVRGRGYRMIAEVHALTDRQGTLESIVPPSNKETSEAGVATTGAATASSPSATQSASPRSARWAPLGWSGGTLIMVVLLAASWAIVHYRGLNKPAERTSVVVSPVIRSLVVLPLENLSGDKEQEYFADGMTDALTTDLAQIGSLRVISRTSAMRLKGSQQTLPQIGRDLQVDAVVEGTVTRGENRVRVTAQLVEASSDHHLWARTYERDLKNVLALQDEIAQDITEQIRVKLTPKERSLLMQVHVVDPEAHDAVLRGLYWFSRGTRDDMWQALDYFQIAIAKDPSYALAYANLGCSFLALRNTGGLPFKEEAVPKAREAVVKALALDPLLSEAHTPLAYIKFFIDWEWSGAEAEFKQAIALNPSNASAHHFYAEYLVAMGRLDEAMKESELAQDLDPLSPYNSWWLGQVLYHARRYDEALRQNQRVLEMQPDNAGFYHAMADMYEQKKMFAEAFTARQKELSLNKDPNVTAFAEAYRRSGYRGYLLKEAQVLEHADNLMYGGGRAHVYALLNDESRAMTALESVYNEQTTRDARSRRVHPSILFIRTAPEFDSIRSSPRFRDLVRRIGFPQPSSDKN